MKRLICFAALIPWCWLAAASAQIQPRPHGGQPGQPPRQSGGRQMVPAPPKMRHAPFRLTRQEYDNLKAVLAAWEQHSVKVELMRCTLVVLDYDTTFNYRRESRGHLQYKAPDKGLYDVKLVRVTNTADGKELDINKINVQQRRQHWVCDGKSVYQFMHSQKKVIRRDLPPQLQGAGIGDGPLPFFFGAKADKLLGRYWMRVRTPPEKQSAQVWIEAYPRYQHDRANFCRATVILDKRTAQPLAVEVLSPNPQSKDRTVYQFSQIQVGRTLLQKIFNANTFDVSVPRGYQLIANPGAPQATNNNGRIPPPKGPRRTTGRRQ